MYNLQMNKSPEKVPHQHVIVFLHFSSLLFSDILEKGKTFLTSSLPSGGQSHSYKGSTLKLKYGKTGSPECIASHLKKFQKY